MHRIDEYSPQGTAGQGGEPLRDAAHCSTGGIFICLRLPEKIEQILHGHFLKEVSVKILGDSTAIHHNEPISVIASVRQVVGDHEGAQILLTDHPGGNLHDLAGGSRVEC
jgi:hypothetical protein